MAAYDGIRNAIAFAYVQLNDSVYIYIYIYIYMCVCVCACMFYRGKWIDSIQRLYVYHCGFVMCMHNNVQLYSYFDNFESV